MKLKASAYACVTVLLVAASAPAADQPPQFPQPTKEHQWLQQLAGEWTYEGECVIAPGQPPIRTTGTETTRTLGGFWVITENRGEFMGMSVTGVMTLGYDPKKQKYVGTWIESMTNYMCRYEGTLDDSGKTLTLNTEGPAMDQPGKMASYREVIELKDKDNKVFTSSIERDGKWVQFVKMTSKRKK